MGGCASVGQWDKGEEIVSSFPQVGVTLVAKHYQDFLSGMYGKRVYARNNGPAAVCVNINRGPWVYVPAGQETLISERWSSGGTSYVDPASSCS